MSSPAEPGEITLWLRRWADGESAVLDHLTPLVYEQLKTIAEGLLHNERQEHTLQPTALVHETFKRLLATHQVSLNDRAHFFTFSARLMRQILVDHARRFRAAKRGIQLDRVPLNDELAWVDPHSEEVLDLSVALDELEKLDLQKSRAIELRYFLGCTVDETAAILSTSPSSVDRSLRFALAWLQARLHPTP